MYHGDIPCTSPHPYSARSPRSAMKDPVEVLRRKEAELQKLQEEVEALRLVGKLLKQKSGNNEESEGRGKIIEMPLHLA